MLLRNEIYLPAGSSNHQDTKDTKKIKMNSDPISQREEQIATAIVDAAYCVHSNLGPGLLEKLSMKFASATN